MATKLSAGTLEALVIGILAVNAFSLEKAWNLLPRLRDAGLMKPDFLVSEDMGSLTVRLARAGYDRGFLTEMMATRLKSLMTSVAAGHLDALDTLLSEKDEKTAVQLLQTVKGIGPTVAKNVWLLLQ